MEQKRLGIGGGLSNSAAHFKTPVDACVLFFPLSSNTISIIIEETNFHPFQIMRHSG